MPQPADRPSEGQPVRVLVVDDEPEVAAAVGDALEIAGYTVRTAPDGQAALAAVTEWEPDALVLDVLMPGLDGLAVCRQLRALGDPVAILVLTARGGLAERVDGLDAGADDYLGKPFELTELLARLRALLRRTHPGGAGGAGGVAGGGAGNAGGSDAGEPDALAFADLSLDPATRTGRRGERTVSFSRTEVTVLEVLLRNPGQTLPREVITERVWGRDFGPSSNSLDVYIGYLRRKLEAGGEPRLVHTVHGIGYRLDTA
jgi:two-component system response regulator MprA